LSEARRRARALAARGVATTALTVDRALHGRDPLLLEGIDRTDLLVVSTPLYVDSFPALLLRAMESIAATRGRCTPPPCALALIVNCGFPEAAQCHTAIEIMRLFARRARFEWRGALALGGGGSIDGRPLDSLGGFARRLRAAIDATAAALADGGCVPPEAIAQMARQLVPARLFTLGGNLGWIRRAVHNGVPLRQLKARPFDSR